MLSPQHPPLPLSPSPYPHHNHDYHQNHVPLSTRTSHGATHLALKPSHGPSDCNFGPLSNHLGLRKLALCAICHTFGLQHCVLCPVRVSELLDRLSNPVLPSLSALDAESLFRLIGWDCCCLLYFRLLGGVARVNLVHVLRPPLSRSVHCCCRYLHPGTSSTPELHCRHLFRQCVDNIRG